MSGLRKIKAIVLGHNTDMDETAATLRSASIPVSAADCRACADPCDEGGNHNRSIESSFVGWFDDVLQVTGNTHSDSMLIWRPRCLVP